MSESQQSPAPSAPVQPVVYLQPMTPVRAMTITVAVLFVLASAWLLFQIREILLLLVFGILVGAAVDPLVNEMRRRGLSRGQSILVIYATIIAIIAVGLYFVIPPLYDQGRALVTNIPRFVERFRQQAEASGNPLLRGAVDRAVEFSSPRGGSPQIPAVDVSQAIGFLTSIVGVLFTVVSMLIVAYYWMTEKALIKRVVLSLFPIAQRDRAHRIWDDIEDRFGGWARGQLVLMAAIGISSTIVYFALGLPFWFLLGIWAGVTEAIPFIGPYLGGGLAVAVALTDSWQKALIVLAFVVVLQQIEGSVLVPRVMKNAVGLTPLTVILALLIGGALLGIIGALLAIPIAAAVQVLVTELLRFREESLDSGEPALAVSVSTVHLEETTEATVAAAAQDQVGTPPRTGPGTVPAGQGAAVVSVARATVREGDTIA